MHVEEGLGEFNYSNDDLEYLRIGNIKSKILDSNPLFQLLRGKLVTFLQKLERHKEHPDLVKIDNLFNRQTQHSKPNNLSECLSGTMLRATHLKQKKVLWQYA